MEMQVTQTQLSHVLPLEDLDDPSTCGAKAWRLAKMHQLGYSVPQAVVIHSRAFEQVLEETALMEES